MTEMKIIGNNDGRLLSMDEASQFFRYQEIKFVSTDHETRNTCCKNWSFEQVQNGRSERIYKLSYRPGKFIKGLIIHAFKKSR